MSSMKPRTKKKNQRQFPPRFDICMKSTHLLKQLNFCTGKVCMRHGDTMYFHSKSSSMRRNTCPCDIWNIQCITRIETQKNIQPIKKELKSYGKAKHSTSRLSSSTMTKSF